MNFKYFRQHTNLLQPKYVGPFQVISLNAFQYVEELLSQLNMEKIKENMTLIKSYISIGYPIKIPHMNVYPG